MTGKHSLVIESVFLPHISFFFASYYTFYQLIYNNNLHLRKEYLIAEYPALGAVVRWNDRGVIALAAVASHWQIEFTH